MKGWKTLSSDWVDLKHVKKALNPTCVQMVGIGDTAAHHKSGVKAPHSVQEEVLKSCKGNEHQLLVECNPKAMKKVMIAFDHASVALNQC